MGGSEPDYAHIIQTLIAERDELKQHCARLKAIADEIAYPPGHFYSPLVDGADPLVLEAAQNRLTAAPPAGVDFDAARIEAMLQRLAVHYPDFQAPRTEQAGHRFYADNPFFGTHDAFIAFAMLREFRPQRVIEIGSGFSSRLLLDINEQFFGNAMDLKFIDPQLSASIPEFGEIPPGLELIPKRVQEVPLRIFDDLRENDILLIDSSHVAKTASDVNHYLFRILPRLRRGVIVHVHDIFYPFEYLAPWVLEEKRSWNEAYLLHAFLQYNQAFSILYWNDFAGYHLIPQLAELAPRCLENRGGSIWLQKLQD